MLKNLGTASYRAIFLIFLVLGIGISSWAPMVPLVKIKLNLNDAQLGLVLINLGLGSIIAMPLTGLIINRFGSRIVVLLSMINVAILLPLIVSVETIWQLGFCLFNFGFVIGATDVAINAQAIHLQREVKDHIMSGLHGMYSVGGLIGALGLGLLIKINFSLLTSSYIIAVLILIIVFKQYQNLFHHSKEQSISRFNLVFPKGKLFLIGILCFIAFLAEGSMLDWSAVFLRFYRDFNLESVGIGFAVFSLFMALFRIVGYAIIRTFGSQIVVVGGAIIATLGLVIVISFSSTVIMFLGFALVGMGLANIVPILFTLAGNIPGVSTAVAIPVVTTIGYSGLLLGPSAIGFISKLYSLPFAFFLLSIFVLGIAIIFPKFQSS